MPYTPFPGPAGGVKYGAGPTAFVGATSWKLDKQVETTPSTNFESSADGNGVVWETLLVGLGSATGSMDCIFDGDATNSEARVPIGTQVALYLYFKKAATAVGFANIPAVITNIGGSGDLREKGKITIQFKVTGAPPVAA